MNSNSKEIIDSLIIDINSNYILEPEHSKEYYKKLNINKKYYKNLIEYIRKELCSHDFFSYKLTQNSITETAVTHYFFKIKEAVFGFNFTTQNGDKRVTGYENFNKSYEISINPINTIKNINFTETNIAYDVFQTLEEALNRYKESKANDDDFSLIINIEKNILNHIVPVHKLNTDTNIKKSHKI